MYSLDESIVLIVMNTSTRMVKKIIGKHATDTKKIYSNVLKY